ncbi:hypothetical protein [Streptomyces syringium]|uniref:hypothetical protein n=1 Tax=Streptomyces syringium TaxID=76729 RepID=UPI0037D2C42A
MAELSHIKPVRRLRTLLRSGGADVGPQPMLSARRPGGKFRMGALSGYPKG